MTETKEPRALLEAIRYFADPDVALAAVVKLRWPDGKPICPRCSGLEPWFLKTRRIWSAEVPPPVVGQRRDQGVRVQRGSRLPISLAGARARRRSLSRRQTCAGRA